MSILCGDKEKKSKTMSGTTCEGGIVGGSTCLFKVQQETGVVQIRLKYEWKSIQNMSKLCGEKEKR